MLHWSLAVAHNLSKTSSIVGCGQPFKIPSCDMKRLEGIEEGTDSVHEEDKSKEMYWLPPSLL